MQNQMPATNRYIVLSKDELKDTIGGASISTIINSLSKGFEFVFELGKSFGSFIRRALSGSFCDLK